ncbi:MAG: hypothetical protein ACLFUH_08515 [Bacteroidales bacterium]
MKQVCEECGKYIERGYIIEARICNICRLTKEVKLLRETLQRREE